MALQKQAGSNTAMGSGQVLLLALVCFAVSSDLHLATEQRSAVQFGSKTLFPGFRHCHVELPVVRSRTAQGRLPAPMKRRIKSELPVRGGGCTGAAAASCATETPGTGPASHR